MLAAAAVGILVVPLWRQRRSSGRWSVVGVVAAVATVPIAVGIYTQVTTWNPVAAEHAAQGQRLVAQLAERPRRTPDDVQGWQLLARSYMALGRIRRGPRAYGEAWKRTPMPDNELKLSYAESIVLADRSTIGGDAGRMVEEVLAAEPSNPKALWYGGLVALEAGRENDVRARWSRLLQMGPPDDVAEVIRNQLADLGGVGSSGQGAPPRAAADNGPKLVFSVRLGEGRSLDQLGASAKLFVFAQAPGGGPPVAVKREPATALPGEFTLSDADSMIPGRSLGDFDELTLKALLSAKGQPPEQPGDWYAEAIVHPKDAGKIDLVIDQVVQ